MNHSSGILKSMWIIIKMIQKRTVSSTYIVGPDFNLPKIHLIKVEKEINYSD
jgi:hypothetical protein